MNLIDLRSRLFRCARKARDPRRHFVVHEYFFIPFDGLDGDKINLVVYNLELCVAHLSRVAVGESGDKVIFNVPLHSPL